MDDKRANGQAARKRLKRPYWYSGLLWTGVFALTVVTIGWVMRMESEETLKQDAELSAVRWTRSLASSQPRPEQLFGSQVPDASTRARLMQIARQNDIARFWLYDLGGKGVQWSTDLDAAGAMRDTAIAGLVGGPQLRSVPVALRDHLLTRTPQVQIQRAAIADGSRVYGIVDVAVVHEGRPIGLARVFIDETKRAQAADAGLQRIVIVVSLLLAVIGMLAAYQQLASRKAQRTIEERLRYVSEHDALSGALNRPSLMAALARETARGDAGKSTFALLRIDLDRFKDINDAFGHAIGDAVLQATTGKLKACLGPKDRLARLEADEFAILLIGPGTREAVVPITRLVQRALAEPMELSGHHVRCNGSIGIALCGGNSRTANTLMNDAESALLRAKRGGRGIFVFHDAERDREVVAQRALTRDLRTALTRGDLSVYYQPQFDGDAQTLIGYEALLRWRHASHGDVSPAVFVPLAEAADLIDEIGQWVLRQACADATRWPTSLGVAVNLSANQFASGTLVQQVSRTLADTGLSANRLCLEITESLLLHNSEPVMQTLRNLHAIGVSIAMDDFGTGFSSLAYLWRFPFDKIKIDQVFTKNMLRDSKVTMIVRSIITLAHALEIRVNAEGVETPEQLAALQDLGCQEFQGFLLGRPGPAVSLTHKGHANGQEPAPPRAEARESLFATVPMDLPWPPSGA